MPSFEASESPHVLELPQIYTKPSYESLITALISLELAPSSWASEREQPRIEDTKAVAAYLTQVVSNGLRWLENDEQRERIYDLASRRLSERSGRTGMAAITRTWTIHATSTCPEIELEIHEPPMTEDHLGLKTWASSYLLAKRLEMIGSRHLEGLLKNPKELRCLELGAGTGLVGLAACCVWGCSIHLTDLPDIVSNLSLNAQRNIETIKTRGGQVTTAVHDWKNPPPVSEFQVILAADPLYSPDHASMLTTNIDQFLSPSSKARIIIEIPIRDEWTEKEAKNLQKLLREKNFDLLEDGFESGFDDWEENGERVVVRCWWGVFGREGEHH